MVISIFISSTLLRQGVCVCTIWIDVKLLIIAGACGTHVLPHAMKLVGTSGKGNVAGFLYLQHPAAIFICIVPPPGAFKSQLGGTYILSLLVYTVIVSCDYIYASYHLIVGVFARPMHSTAKSATTVLIKCVWVKGCVTVCIKASICKKNCV